MESGSRGTEKIIKLSVFIGTVTHDHPIIYFTVKETEAQPGVAQSGSSQGPCLLASCWGAGVGGTDPGLFPIAG